MFIRCEKYPLRIGGDYVKVGDTVEVSDDLLAQLKPLVDRGLLSLHERDAAAARKVRKDAKGPVPKKKPTRARTEDGEFIADDKSTPDVDEAWVGGQAPTNINSLRKAQLVSLAKSLKLPLSGSETKTVLIKQIKEARGE